MDTTKLIDQAKVLIEKGEKNYHEAAEKLKLALDAGATQREVATALGRNQSWVQRLVRWHTSDASMDQVTPFGRDGDTGTHKRQVKHSLSKMSKEERGEIIAEAVAADTEVAQAVASHPVAKARIAVATKKKEKEAGERIRARNFEEEQDSQGIAVIRVGSRCTEIKAELRMLVLAYQEGIAANPDDDDLRQVLVDMIVGLKGDVIVALDTLVGDGVDAALAQILQSEGGR